MSAESGSPRPDRPARATLAVVARDAAVSMSTVSKVLNGRSGVSDATRRRVEDLLEKHGYAPRGAAQVSRTLEVVFFELDTEWLLEVLLGVERVAREQALNIMLTRSHDLHTPAREWIDEVIQRRPVGVVLLFSDLGESHKCKLRNRSIPYVVVDPAGDPAPDVPSVGSQNWSGGVAATDHLISLGHRDIATITGPEDMMCSRARTSGFLSSLAAAGIEPRPGYVLPGHFHTEDGRERGRELLSGPHPPTAIFAGSDLQALGVYEAARELGVRIPQDLSVVGYDDLRIARWAGPPLTTVRQPITEMAETATRLVLRMREDPLEADTRIDLATRLVVRASTAPPRPA